MKKKSVALLNETVVRKFMKLANLGKLTENFVDKLEEDDKELPEDEPEEDVPEEAPVGAGPELDAEPEMPEAEPEGGMGGVGEEVVERLVDAIADAIEGETGVAIDVAGAGAEGGEDLEGGEELPPTEEPGLGAPPPQDLTPPGLEGEEDEEPIMEEEAGKFGGKQKATMTAAKKPESAIKAAQTKAGVVSESKLAREKLISEITSRVVARIKAEAKKAKK